MKTLFAVDGNWFLHRIWHTLHTSNSDKGDALSYGVIAKVCVDALAVKANHVVVAFDGADVFRYRLFSGYKANRTTDGKAEIYSYLPKVIRRLESCGIQVVQLPKYEADDVLCTIAHMYQKHYKVICGTIDKDSFQYLSSSVTLYDSSFKKNGKPHPRYLGPQSVKDKIGLPPSLSIAYQTLIGDGADGIPKVITPAKARKALIEHGSIKAWALADPKMRKVLRANKPQLRLNKKLVTLVKDCLPDDFELKAFRRSTETKLPKSYYALADFLQPRSKGLF